MIGDPNINLTEEYLQEERVSNSDLDEEEKQQMSVIYRFRIVLFQKLSLIINSFKDGLSITDENNSFSAGICII